MEQLKQAWVYRFWIAAGVVVVLPIVGYFVNTRTLAASAATRKAQLESTAKTLKTTSEQNNPNTQWAQETTKKKEALSVEVDGAWEELYRRQIQYMEWPTREFKVAFEDPKAKTELPNIDLMLDYQASFHKQLEDLLNSIKPVRPSQNGLVKIDEAGFYKKFEPPWSGSTEPTTVPEILVAQEDVWILRAIFDVVNHANEGATKWEESAIKEIRNIEFANMAATDARFRSSKSPMVSGDNQPPPAAGGASRGGAPLRYLPSGTLFRQVPIAMDMFVEQWNPEKKEPRAVKVLGAFANSGIPMQITEVDFVENSQKRPVRSGATGSGAKSITSGLAPPKDDTYFQMARMGVHARAYLYEKPDTMKDAEKAPAAAASPNAAPGASPTPAGAQR